MSKFKKVMNSLELIRCQKCNGDGGDCLACFGTGIKCDPRGQGDKKISAWVDTVIDVCEKYSELVA